MQDVETQSSDRKGLTETREAISFCRICSGGCGTRLSIDGHDRLVGVRGDRSNQLTRGYACFKGLNAAESHNHPDRLLRPQKRAADGSFRPIGSEQALDEIAHRLRKLIETDGPDSIAVFCGNGSMPNSSAYPMHPSFLKAIGSRQYFSTLTIDQSAKMIAFGRLGGWAGGVHEIEQMDVLLMFGANPLISHAASGLLAYDPVRQLKQAKARGLKLVVIDPRRTETGHFADLHLQPFPGQDAAIVAGLVRLILEEGWDDADFCARHVGGERMRALRRAVEPFTVEMVESRAGLETGQLRQVAELFARDSRIGIAYGSTGPNMTAFSNLAQHMIEVLNVVCGRFPRAGEAVRRSNVQGPRAPRVEQVIAASRLWESEGPSRIRGAGSLFGERLSSTLPDEILTAGKGRIRALIVDGGNPALSLPDQQKTVKALSSLDLLVTIDPWMTPTSRLAHYVLAPTMQYEHADLSLTIPGFDFWPGRWAQYTPAILPPPPGADVVNDWYVFWALAKRLGKPIDFAGRGEIPLDRRPTTDDVLALKIAGGQVTLDELKQHPHGNDFAGDLGTVEPPRDPDAKFDVMPDDVASELAAFLADMDEEGRLRRDGRSYRFLMSTRRLRDVFNSSGTQLPAIRRRTPYNPVHLNGADMDELGIGAGDLVELASSHGRVVMIAERDDSMRKGVVATTHGWGGLPGSNADPADVGTCVNLLIDGTKYVESINAMPHFSGVPVDIARLADQGVRSAAE